MCNFLSVLVLKNGRILHHPMLDSHADLVAYFNLPDDTPFLERFAKAELTPVDWLDPSTWKWRIDEAMRPQWLEDVEATAEAATRAIAKKMILTGDTKIPRLIVDGCWIVGGKSVVRDVRGGRIIRVQDSAQVSLVRGSAQVSHVWGSAQVSHVWGSAQVSHVGDSAQVSHVGGSAQVSDVWGSAQVSDVWDSAQVSHVWGSAQVSDVGDSAQVSHVRGSAQVSHVWGSAQVSDVGENVVLDDSAKAHLVGQVAK